MKPLQRKRIHANYRRLPWALLSLCFLTSPASIPRDRKDSGFGQEACAIRAALEDGRYQQAGENSRALLQVVESSQEPDSLDMARALDLLVRSQIFYDRPPLREWVEMARRALRIKESLLPADDPEVAASLIGLGDTLLEAGGSAEGNALYERAMTIQAAAFGAESPEVAEALVGIGRARRRLLDFVGARTALEKALSIQEKTRRGDPADTLLLLGTLEWEQGDYASEKNDAARSLAIREETLRPDHPQIAMSLNSLALALLDTGDLSAAIEADRKALEIRLRSLGPEHGEVGSSLNNLGIKLMLLGDYASAYEMIDRASRIGLAVNGPDHPSAGHGSTNLGEVLLQMKKYPEAARELEEAIRIKERVNGKNHWELISTLSSLAQVRIATGDYAEAQALLERASAIALKTYGDRHPQVALRLNQRAELAILQGHYNEAGGLALQAVALLRALGPGLPDTGEALITQARVAWARGRSAETLKLSLEANSLLRNHLRRAAQGLSEREALSYEAIRSSGLDLAISVILKNPRIEGFPDAVRAVWNEEMRSRALVLDEMAARHRGILESDEPDAVILFQVLEQSKSRLARLVQRGPTSNQDQAFGEALRSAQGEEERAERALAAGSARFRETQQANGADFPLVLRGLPDESVLVAYVKFHRIDSGEEPLTPSSAEPKSEYAAFVLASVSNEPQVLPLGPAELIEGLVRRWNESAGVEPSEPETTLRTIELGRSLRRAIWDPIAAILPPAERVFVVPEGALNLVSLDTLPTDGNRYLVETSPLIHYFSAERDLVRSDEPGREGEGLLAVGGPDFDMGGTSGSDRPASLLASLLRGARPRCENFQSLKFAPLPGSLAEVDEVGSLWRTGRMSGNVVKLTGRGATETAFKSMARGKRVLHLATHSFFVDERCQSSLRDAEESGSLGAILAGVEVSGESPLLLSGLAMAGANQRGNPSTAQEQDDGILTAAEVASLDLRGVEWAVLSACETGVGPVQAGEGVLGLRRAFQSAGARTVIMSLWPVADVQTREWFRSLYQGHASGLSTVESARRASLTVLEARRKAEVSTHPFFWGGFIVSGDWR